MDKIKRRFDKLEMDVATIAIDKKTNYAGPQDWRKWALSVLNLFSIVFGESSPQYTYFQGKFNSCHGHFPDIQAMTGLFLSAKEDYCEGYVFDLQKRISGEIFGDFVN